MGPVTVGSSPAQAVNAFVDECTWRLPNSGLQGNISRTYQIYFPDDPEIGRQFLPDIEVKWEDFKDNGFSNDTPLSIAIANALVKMENH